MEQVDVVRVLLNRGAEVNPRVFQEKEPRILLLEIGKTPYDMAKTKEVKDLLRASGGRGACIIDLWSSSIEEVKNLFKSLRGSYGSHNG